MKKILIIQTASIGDVVLATALLNSLKLYDKSFQIDFLAKSSSASVLFDHPHIRKIILWDKSNRKYKNLFNCIGIVRKERYDLIVNVHRFFSSGLIVALGRARKTSGFKQNPLSFLFGRRVKHLLNIHEVERNHFLIKDFFPEIKSQMPIISVEEFNLSDYSLISGSYITIAPGSLWETKKLPVSVWSDFVRSVPKKLNIVLVGSDIDFQLSENIFTNVSRSHLNLCGKISLRQTAYLMKNACMNYANDSAPTHLASACNAPIATVFCSTVPAFGFGPLSLNSHIIEIENELDCRPCGIHGHRECPKKHFECGKRIKTEQLLKVL